MKPNLHAFDRAVRAAFGIFLLFAVIVFYTHPLARLFMLALGLWSLGEAVSGKCPAFARMGKMSVAPPFAREKLYLLGLFGVQTALAYEWWVAGYGKVLSGTFVDALPKILGNFAAKNPFPWYRDFLLGFATRNVRMFGYAVEWGEILTACGLFLGALALLFVVEKRRRKQALMVSMTALAVGAFLSASFYLAAGWTSESTQGVNFVMFWSEVMLLYVWKAELLTLE